MLSVLLRRFILCCLLDNTGFSLSYIATSKLSHSYSSRGWNGSTSTMTNSQTGGQTDEYIHGYQKFCMLWDGSCSGNQAAALHEFDHDISWLNGSACQYISTGTIGIQCDRNSIDAPEASKSAFAEMLTFARSPRCTSLYGKKPLYHDIYGGTSLPGIGPCCGPCDLAPTVVDPYYWPEKGADTSRLSIIGDSVDALDFGATTSTFAFLID